MSMFGLFGIIDVLFPIIFVLFFIVFFFMIFFIVTRSVKEWKRDENSPRLTVRARVVSKRGDVHRNTVNNTTSHTYTNYYATFQFDSGDRLELNVPSNEYGYLVEGDDGELSFQGKRFLSFTRAV